MTLKQLTMLRNSYMKESTRPDGRRSTLGEYMRIILDSGIEVVTSKDLVVFDDENEILHAVCINDDMRIQCDFPVKIISSDYSMIQQVESVMSQRNFETLLKDGYMADILSEEKSKAMIKWTRGITNQAQQPLDSEPYFNTNPKVIPMAASKIERPIDNMCIYRTGNGIENFKTLKEAFDSVHSGTITLCEDATISETIEVHGGEIILDLAGFSITAEQSKEVLNELFLIKDGAKLTVRNGIIHTIDNEVFRVDDANPKGDLCVDSTASIVSDKKENQEDNDNPEGTTNPTEPTENGGTNQEGDVGPEGNTNPTEPAENDGTNPEDNAG